MTQEKQGSKSPIFGITDREKKMEKTYKIKVKFEKNTESDVNFQELQKTVKANLVFFLPASRGSAEATLVELREVR